MLSMTKLLWTVTFYIHQNKPFYTCCMGMNGVFDFGGNVIGTLTELTGVQLPMDPAVHLLNDDSRMDKT